jgi:tetratricopeptide (TPR) repeat protein
MSAGRVSVAITAAVVVIAAATGARAAPPRDNAKAIFQDGERNFQLGKFDVAIEAYERAFNLDPQPAFIFNIALAHRRQYEIDGKLEHLLRARELYRNYLKLDPDSPQRPGVEKLITELGARIDQARAGRAEPPPAAFAPAPTPPAPAPPVAAPPPAAPTPTPDPLPLVTEPAIAARSEDQSSSTKTWLIAGGITAVVIAAAVTVLLVTRSGPSFDGPGIDVTPQ